MTFQPFSRPQKTALTWWTPASPYSGYEAIICDGAVRSGKTLCTGLSFFLWAMCRFDGERFGICGKTIRSVRRNLFGEVLPVLEELGFPQELVLNADEERFVGLLAAKRA